MRKGVTDDPAIIKDIMDRAEMLWLALVDEDGPHSVPVNFALIGETIYLHSGFKGRKAAALQSGAPVAFSAAVDVHLRPGGDNACDQGYYFKSVMGRGTPRLTEGEEKMRGLDAVTVKHLGRQLPYIDKVLPKTAVFAIDIESVTARIKQGTKE